MAESLDWSRTAEYWAVVSGVAALVSVASALVPLGYRAWHARQRRRTAAQLAEFIKEGGQLYEQARTTPQPTIEHAEWIARMETFVERELGPAYRVRVSNFAGMTFFSGAGALRNNISGRLQRLDEFVSELQSK
jgi:hypothetical protein